MSLNVAPGKQVRFYNGSGGNYAKSSLVVLAGGLALLMEAIADTASGEVLTEGVVRLTKAAGASTAIVEGQSVFVTIGVADHAATKTAGPLNYYAGVCVRNASDDDTVVNVKLMPFSAEGGRLLTAAAAAATVLGPGAAMSGRLYVKVPNTTTVTVTLPAVATVPVGSVIEVQKSDATAAAITIAAHADDAITGTLPTVDASLDRVTLIAQPDGWTLIAQTIA